MSIFTACAVVLEANDRFILIRETRAAKTGLYNLPAGGLEADESALECALREAHEETGIEDINIKDFLGVYEVLIGGNHHVLLLVFSGSVDPSAALGSVQHPEVHAFSYEEILILDKSGQLRSPTILRAIDDYRNGRHMPLSTVHTWSVAKLDSITVAPAAA